MSSLTYKSESGTYEVANALMEHYVALVQERIVEILDEEIVKEVGGDKLISYLLDKELGSFICDLREDDNYCYFIDPTFQHDTCCVVSLSGDGINYYHDFE